MSTGNPTFQEDFTLKFSMNDSFSMSRIQYGPGPNFTKMRSYMSEILLIFRISGARVAFFDIFELKFQIRTKVNFNSYIIKIQVKCLCDCLRNK